MNLTCPACLEDVEVEPEPIDDPQFNYRVSCSTSGCEFETKANAVPSIEEFVRAKLYAALETGSGDDLRSFHHADRIGVPGGTVDIYVCVTDAGETAWVIQSLGSTGVYRSENYENIEAAFQEHADLERELFEDLSE